MVTYKNSPQKCDTNEGIVKHKNSLLKCNTNEEIVKYKNSPLTDLMKDKNYRSLSVFFNCSWAILIAYTGGFYLEKTDRFWRHMQAVAWSLSNLKLFAMQWLAFHLFAFGIFAGFTVWISVRSRIKSKIIDRVFLLSYMVVLVFMVTAPPFAVSKKIRPAINFALACEHVRVLMKVHSFVRESVPKVLQRHSSKDSKEMTSLYPEAKHYLYFLFAPTFIYKESYKRRQSISLKFISHNMVRFLKGIIISYYVFTFIVIDHFQNTGKHPFSVSDTVKMAAVSMFGGMALFLTVNYSFLHAWLNMFAEALRFEDRYFYGDWWNLLTVTEFYRKWNIVVSGWIRTYVYMDLNKIGLGKFTPAVASFFLSAAVHELIIVQCIGFFYPIIPVIILLTGVFCKLSTKERSSLFWNYMLLLNIPVGTGFFLFFYSLEFFARTNCPSTMDSTIDFFIPRSWGNSCKIFAFL